MSDHLLARPAVLAPAVIIIGYLLYHLVFKPSVKLPVEFPIIGAKDGDWFPTLQAKWRNTTNFKATLHLAETQFRNQPVILPLLGVPNLILLPRSDIAFVQDQDRSVLDLRAETDFRLQLKYTSPNPDLMNLHAHLVQNKSLTDNLSSQVGALIPSILEETAYTLNKHWGNSAEWTEVGVYETSAQMLALVSNRAFVGSPTNRNPKLLEVGMKYAVDLPLKSAIIRCLWTPISPLVAYLLTIPVRRYAREFEKILEPEIKRRIALYDAKHGYNDPKNKISPSNPEPNDALQWILNSAKATGDALMWKPSTIADRVLILNFASIHTSEYALTQTIIELAWSKQEYIDQLREEIKTALAESSGQWTKRAVAKMVKLDSTFRESSRLNSFQPAGLGRVVMSQQGIKTPSSGGVVIPRGASVVVPAYNAHRDKRVYPDPETFHPFRFVEGGVQEGGSVKSAPSSYVNTGSDFLAFGSGKYACTGRFFAAVELKVMLGYILLNYDIEVREGCVRPESRWIVWNVIMPLEATIRVRRRVVGQKVG